MINERARDIKSVSQSVSQSGREGGREGERGGGNEDGRKEKTKESEESGGSGFIMEYTSTNGDNNKERKKKIMVNIFIPCCRVQHFQRQWGPCPLAILAA